MHETVITEVGEVNRKLLESKQTALFLYSKRFQTLILWLRLPITRQAAAEMLPLFSCNQTLVKPIKTLLQGEKDAYWWHSVFIYIKNDWNREQLVHVDTKYRIVWIVSSESLRVKPNRYHDRVIQLPVRTSGSHCFLPDTSLEKIIKLWQ